MMRTLPEKSINCCVTSPPYFGLRDYGYDGQIGLEPTPEKFVGKLVEVFREVRRVLRDDGTLWVNLGDSYNAHQNQRKTTDKAGNKQQSVRGAQDVPSRSVGGCKPKDLIGIPWRVAFALQADGWYLRQDIIWHKPNPMPESVSDRCTKAHEYIFLLSKSQKYYFDGDAIKEQSSGGNAKGNSKKLAEKAIKRTGNFITGGTEKSSLGVSANEKRNRRSVWTVATRPYSGAHFATYPTELIRPCILAGCPKGGVVLDPFGGSGTTAAVANEEGRDAILCELNPEYIPLINKRLSEVQPKLF